MINTVLKRIRARPTLSRGNKSHSDSTMETNISDNQSIPSNSSGRNVINGESSSSSAAGTAAAAVAMDSGDEIDDDDLHNDDDDHDDDDYSSSTPQQQQQQQQLGTKTAATRKGTSSTTTTTTKRRTTVCFACDFGDKVPYEVIESSTSGQNSSYGSCQDEPKDCFYSAAEISSFDRDRALTVLMYQTRNKSIPWDDNVHSIRGLEEYTTTNMSTSVAAASSTVPNLNHLITTIPSYIHNNIIASPITSSTSSSSSTRRTTRKELIQAVLAEQVRLRDSPEGRDELRLACKGYGITEKELYYELLRGVSCSLSKLDKQRAIQLANADEREVNTYYKHSGMTTTTTATPNSRRRYLNMMKGNHYWANTSNKSIHSTGTCSSTGTPDQTIVPILRNNSNHTTTSSTSSISTTATTTTTPFVTALFGNRMRQVSFDCTNHSSSNHETENNNDDDDNDDHNDNNNNNDGGGTTTTTTSTWRQQLPVPPLPTTVSPLSIIQQVVSETSKSK